MFDIEDRSWVKASAIADSASAEIWFCLARAFHPDPNSLDETRTISLPAFYGASSETENISSTSVLGNEQVLIKHYNAVLQLAGEHGHTYNDFSHHMHLALQIGWVDKSIDFAWYDTLEPMEALFDWLINARHEEIWWDVEQGWEMIAVRAGAYFHFRQGGFDQGDEYANIAFPRDELLGSLSTLRQRVRAIVIHLSNAIGTDYWSYYRDDLTSGP